MDVPVAFLSGMVLSFGPDGHRPPNKAMKKTYVS